MNRGKRWLLLVGLGFCVGNNLATDRYVSPTGNDLNPGTLASPYKTLTKALSVRLPDDKIILRAGSYPLPVGSHALVPVPLSAYPGEAVTLVETSGSSYTVTSTLTTWTDVPAAIPIPPAVDVRLTLRPGGPITRAQWSYRTKPTGLAYCYVDKGTTVEVAPAMTPGVDVRLTLRPGGPITRAQWSYRGNPTGLAYCYVDQGTTVEVVK